jgi:uncharacterized repeat protein (TIGR03803 family)
MSRLGDRGRNRLFAGILPLAMGLVMAMSVAPHSAAAAYRQKTLHNFCASGTTACLGGQTPAGGLIMDDVGNLYGTTQGGGSGRRCVVGAARGCGVAFALTPDKTRANGWTETVLYRFCPLGYPCLDGAVPNGGLFMDPAGNLYGTTYSGGNASESGVVFELTPNKSRTAWTETVLYTFCRLGQPCADGAGPNDGLIMDAAGNLYGTTGFGGGGAHNGGVVFELTPNKSRTAWTETVLYSFCQARNCADGGVPRAGLIADAAGNLYGTTLSGVFELTPNKSRTGWNETVLYSFCSRGGPYCADGKTPVFGVIMDAASNLYGTTVYGGQHRSDDGVVFELTPNKSRTAWTETVLYSFCPVVNCADGQFPGSGLILDGSGNLYGTTQGGGGGYGYGGDGVVFVLTPSKSRTAWTETVLYSFCPLRNCADGQTPGSGLILDGSGNLYGTTGGGGVDGNGVVFELVKSR